MAKGNGKNGSNGKGVKKDVKLKQRTTVPEVVEEDPKRERLLRNYENLGRRSTTLPETYIGLGNKDPFVVLTKLVQLGLTNKEIAEVYGLTEQDFASFLAKNEQVRNIITQTRMRPNFLVESALFKRAVGFRAQEVTFQEDKPIKVLVREVFPDVTAQIFWLKNRDPERWKDVMDINISLRDRMARAHAAKNSKEDYDD